MREFHYTIASNSYRQIALTKGKKQLLIIWKLFLSSIKNFQKSWFMVEAGCWIICITGRFNIKRYTQQYLLLENYRPYNIILYLSKRNFLSKTTNRVVTSIMWCYIYQSWKVMFFCLSEYKIHWLYHIFFSFLYSKHSFDIITFFCVFVVEHRFNDGNTACKHRKSTKKGQLIILFHVIWANLKICYTR